MKVMYGTVEEWNTRPIEDALRNEIVELKAQLQAMEYIQSEADNVGLPLIEQQIKELQSERDALRKQVEIAVEALKKIADHKDAGWGYRECADIHDAIVVIASIALAEIERLETGSQDKPDNGA